MFGYTIKNCRAFSIINLADKNKNFILVLKIISLIIMNIHII